MKISRRTFLKTATLTGAALIVGFDGKRLLRANETIATSDFQPNGWIRIDAQGAVALTLGKSEMGQGVRTALLMILADELGADWSRIRVVQAMPGPNFKRLGTGGSGSVQGSWKPLREAAAAAREMLTAAAARRWKVDPATCATENGMVRHEKSSRQLEFGQLVEEAAKLSIPQAPRLKSAADFRLIGHRTARIDARDIVSGATKYGIDTRVPGMLYASIERPPAPGAKPRKWNEKAASAIRGVRAVLPVISGVAVAKPTSLPPIQNALSEWANRPCHRLRPPSPMRFSPRPESGSANYRFTRRICKPEQSSLGRMGGRKNLTRLRHIARNLLA